MSSQLPTEFNSKAQLEHELDAWKSLKINIGVMGNKSELKRLLINKLVGVTSPPDQLTTESFSHSNNLNLVVWDLNASNKEDLSKVDLNKYDLLILFKDTHTPNDRQLIEEVERHGKKCLVVTFDSAEKLDLSRLHLDIMEALTVLTRDHLASYGMTIEPISNGIIQGKTDILRSRIEKIAMLSSMFGHLFRLPRVSIICDAAKLASEIWLYREQLGLSPEHLGKLSAKFNQKVSEVISRSKFASLLLIRDLNSLTGILLKMLPVLFLSNDAIDLVRVLPAAESVLHGTISYASQKLALINILEEFSKISTDLRSLTDKAKGISGPVSASVSINRRN